ncbi:MAG: IS5 family transposase [Deltaproteobacteria bacterium]|nr:IS5 family transposase [Deltaproteobacteria bacterium]
MNRRHELSEKQWQKFKEYLPPQKPETGRPAEDHRKIINGIFWKVRTGAPWRDIPERYGPWTTIYSRFRRWRDAGVWNRILAELQAESDSEGHVDWTIHFVDTTIVRAHQHAAGAKKGGREQRLLAVVEVDSRPRSTFGRKEKASR